MYVITTPCQFRRSESVPPPVRSRLSQANGWMFKGGIDLYQRKQTLSLYPYYRKQTIRYVHYHATTRTGIAGGYHGKSQHQQTEPKIFRVTCKGSHTHAKIFSEYDAEIKSCKAANQLYGGNKVCEFGCLGLADCVKACEFDAIHIKDGVAVIDEDKCVACGQNRVLKIKPSQRDCKNVEILWK